MDFSHKLIINQNGNICNEMKEISVRATQGKL